MIIVRINERSINRYIRRFKKGLFKKPAKCPLCDASGKMSWHAEYIRKLITLAGTFQIPVKRLFCHHCNRTFALLPDFVRKFHRYAVDVIAFVVKNMKKHHCDYIADILMDKYSLYISNVTLYAWKKKYFT